MKNTSLFGLWEWISFHKSPIPAVPVPLILLNALLPNTQFLPHKVDALLLLSSVSCLGAMYSAHRLSMFKVCLSSGIASSLFLFPSTEVRKHKQTCFLRAVSSSLRLPRTRMCRKLIRIRKKRTMDVILRISTYCSS